MQQYDVTLKLLLESAKVAVHDLAGTTITKWIDVELPDVKNRRVDLLGETIDGELVHLEIQTSNDTNMPRRMAEYCLDILRLFGKWPRQILVYVGSAPLRMPDELSGPNMAFRYHLTDIRALDGEKLLASSDVGDNVIAILARLRDLKEDGRRILERFADLPPAERQLYLKQLLILAGLRKCAAII